MKKILFIAFTAFINTTLVFSQSLASDTCITVGGGSGNVVVFANYDGGVLNINVDQNIPNLKIGVCTYEPVTINLSGAYVNNVTEVRYAGYVSTSNHHCANSPVTTTINGAPGGATTSVNFLPAATLSNPNGYSLIVCGYSCDNNSNQGGCNTADQIADYFATGMGGTIHSYFTQYGCWSNTPYNVSAGGNCIFSSTTDTTITQFSSTSSAVCVGQPVNFTDLSPGATSWNWTATGSNIPTSTNQHLTGVTWSAPGTYTVSLSTNDGTGICSATQTITVFDNPTLNIGATPNPICPGDTTILQVTGGQNYVWENGPTLNTWMVSPSTNTWYTVTGTDMNGCSTTDSILVTLYPAPPTPTLNYSGGLLTASPAAPVYHWYLNGNLIVGATNANYTPTQNGVYTVSYTDANGCTSSLSLPTTVSDIGAGIFEMADQIQIYPNPGTGIFNVSLPQTGATEMLMEVVDMLGKLIYSKTVLLNTSYTLDLSNCSKGIYQITLSNGKKMLRSKIIIQ